MRIKTLFILILIFTLSACDRKANISSPLKYDKQNISFSYPSNWEVSDENNTNVRLLIISTSSNAVLMIHIFKGSEAPTLKSFSQYLSKSISKEMPFGDMKTESFNSIKKQVASDQWTGIIEKVSVKLLAINVPHEREYYTLNKNNKQAFFTTQIMTDEKPLSQDGFDLILKTFNLNAE